MLLMLYSSEFPDPRSVLYSVSSNSTLESEVVSSLFFDVFMMVDVFLPMLRKPDFD
jgi:hypothetical protein